MNIITPFNIFNRRFNEMDLIRDTIKQLRLATERLHNEYRDLYKNYQFAQTIKKYHDLVENPTFNNSLLALLQV